MRFLCCLGAGVLVALLAAAAQAESPQPGTHPDGVVLWQAVPEPAAMGTPFVTDLRDIAPLRVRFPDLPVPFDLADHPALRAGQVALHMIRARRMVPPVAAWFGEKVFLGAALAADTQGRFGGIPGLAPPGAEPRADPGAAYVAAVAILLGHYGAGADRALLREADLYRRHQLAALQAAPGAVGEALRLGVARGERVAAAVIARFPRLDPARLALPPAAVRAEMAATLPVPPRDPRMAWSLTPAPAHVTRQPFEDRVALVPGMALEPTVARIAVAERLLPPFPAWDSPEWHAALAPALSHGGRHAPCRSAGQELTGWMFEASASGPPAEVALAALAYIGQTGMPIDGAARVQGLVWSAMATAGILTWGEKYRLNILRPQTAAGRLQPGAGWEPLGPTPPFPAYPSGHAAFTPAGLVTLALVMAEGAADPLSRPLLIGSAAPEGWSALQAGDGRTPMLAFARMGDVISAANESRGYLGIHWEPDGIWGRYLGTLSALRTHAQVLGDPANPTRPGVVLPGLATTDGLIDRWPGVARPWSVQFAATGACAG